MVGPIGESRMTGGGRASSSLSNFSALPGAAREGLGSFQSGGTMPATTVVYVKYDADGRWHEM